MRPNHELSTCPLLTESATPKDVLTDVLPLVDSSESKSFINGAFSLSLSVIRKRVDTSSSPPKNFTNCQQVSTRLLGHFRPKRSNYEHRIGNPEGTPGHPRHPSAPRDGPRAKRDRGLGHGQGN